MSEPERIVKRRSSSGSARAIDAFDTSILADDLPGLVALIDNEQGYRCVSRAYEEFFGKPKTEIIGKIVGKLAGPEHFAVAEQYVGRGLDEDRRFAFAVSLRRGDVSLQDVE